MKVRHIDSVRAGMLVEVKIGMVVETHQFVGLLLELEHNWCNKFGTNQFFTTIPTGAPLQFAPKVLADSLPGFADTLFCCWGLVVVSLVAFVLVV